MEGGGRRDGARESREKSDETRMLIGWKHGGQEATKYKARVRLREKAMREACQ